MLHGFLFAGIVVVVIAALWFGARPVISRVQVARANIEIREGRLKEAAEELLKEIRARLAAVSPGDAGHQLRLDCQLRYSKEANPWWKLFPERDTVAVLFHLSTTDSVEKFDQETLPFATLAVDDFLEIHTNPLWYVELQPVITRTNQQPKIEQGV